MKINVKKIGVLSASLVTVGMFSLGGVAGAQGMGPGGWEGGPNGFQTGFNRFGGLGGFNRMPQNRFTENNTNDVMINNINNQMARTGNASVIGNRFGGNAITGDATNINRNNFDVNIRNM